MKAEFVRAPQGSWKLKVTPENATEEGVFQEVKNHRVRFSNWGGPPGRIESFSLIFEEGPPPPRFQCPCCDGTAFTHTQHWCQECQEFHSEQTLRHHAANERYRKA